MVWERVYFYKTLGVDLEGWRGGLCGLEMYKQLDRIGQENLVGCCLAKEGREFVR